jgi:hypothetical protein
MSEARTAMEVIEAIKAKREEQGRLLAKLERGVCLQAKYGVAAHQIRSITLVPSLARKGAPRYAEVADGRVAHGSRVTMHDGSQREFGFNLMAVLEGWEPLNGARPW